MPCGDLADAKARAEAKSPQGGSGAPKRSSLDLPRELPLGRRHGADERAGGSGPPPALPLERQLQLGNENRGETEPHRSSRTCETSPTVSWMTTEEAASTLGDAARLGDPRGHDRIAEMPRAAGATAR